MKIFVPSVVEFIRKRIYQMIGLPFKHMTPEEIALENAALVAHLNHVPGRPCIPGFDAHLELLTILCNATEEQISTTKKCEFLLRASALEKGFGGTQGKMDSPMRKRGGPVVKEAKAGVPVEPVNAPEENPFQIEVTEFGDGIEDARGNL